MSQESNNYPFIVRPNDAGPNQSDYINEQSFLDYISKYQGTDWYNQYLNAYNAYKSQKFSPNFFQSLGWNLFGDNAPWTNFENQRLSTFYDSLARIQDAQHQENYNSFSNQASLERIAGFNPDLVGVQSSQVGQPGNIDSAELAQPALNDGANLISDIASIGSQIISTAFQLYSGFQSLRSADLDNLTKSLGFSGAITDEAWRVIREGTAEYFNGLEPSPGLSVESYMKDGKQFFPLVESLKSRADRLPYSHRVKSRIKSSLQDLIFTLSQDADGGSAYSFSSQFEALMNEIGIKLNTSRSDYAKSYGAVGADSSSQAALRFIGQVIYRPISDLLLQVEKAQASYNSAYLTSVNGEIAGNAFNAENTLKISLGSIKNRLTKTFEDINKKITGSKDLSPIWKLALQAGVTSAEAFSLSKLMHF